MTATSGAGRLTVLLTRLRRGGRRAPDPLGGGVWRRVHDRTRRAVDRYHQVLERVPDGEARDALELVGADLAGVLDVVRAQCLEAQRAAPSDSLDVPAGPHAQQHRRLSQAAGAVAQAAEAAAMAQVAARSGDDRGALARATSARRAAQRAASLASPPATPAP